MPGKIDVLQVVERGAAERPVGRVEPGRQNQIDRHAEAGCETQQRARVLRDVRLVEGQSHARAIEQRRPNSTHAAQSMRIAHVLKTALLLIAALYVLIVIAGYFGQRRLLYFPDPQRTPPARAGLRDVRELTIATPDGQTLIAWYGKAKPGKPTLLFFHGNGGALEHRGLLMRKYLDHGYGMMMLAYRGFGGSTGSPTEKDNVADAGLAYDRLVAEGVPPADIILYGESLGSGVAIQVAGVKKAAGLILDSPFTSVADRAAEIYPFLPVRLLLADRYDSSRHIRMVHIPLLVIHGEADQVVPVRMGRALFALANEPKAIATFPGGGHNDHDLYGSFDAVARWIVKLRSQPMPMGNTSAN